MNQWKHYYTRPTVLQDYEPIFIRAILREGTIKEILYVPHEGKWEAWYKEDEWNAYMKKLGDGAMRPSWRLDRHLREFAPSSNEVLTRARNASRLALHGQPHKKICKEYEAYTRAYARFSLYIYLPWSIAYYLELLFVERLKKETNDWQNIFEALAKSTRMNTQEKLECALARWKLQHGSQKALEQIAARFGFFRAYSTIDPVWTADDLAKQARELTNPAKHLREVAESKRRNRRGAKQALLRIKNPLTRKIGALIHEYTWLRDARVDPYKQGMVLLQPFYRWFEREFGLPKFWASNLSHDEIISFLSLDTSRHPEPTSCHPERSEGSHAPRNRRDASPLVQHDTIVCISDLQNRAHHGYLAHMMRDKTTVISDPKEQAAFIKKHLPSFEKPVTGIVRGKTAFPGNVTGRVRRILKAKDAVLMQIGEILVANMTHPDFMPAIKKAAAIVTDEGGVVCHAAIIARELKIPAVIGCGNATKAFKDGDLVIVNATEGTACLQTKKQTLH